MTTDFGLQVAYSNNHRAEVKVPPEYKTKMCGICGNWNDDPDDDKFANGGTSKVSYTQIGNSWIVPDDSGEDNAK